MASLLVAKPIPASLPTAPTHNGTTEAPVTAAKTLMNASMPLETTSNATATTNATSAYDVTEATAMTSEKTTLDPKYVAKKIIAFWYVVGFAAFLLFALVTTVIVCATVRVKVYNEKLFSAMDAIFRSVSNFLKPEKSDRPGGAANNFIGMKITSQGRRLKVRALLAEDESGQVFSAQDVKNKETWFAVKRHVAVEPAAVAAVQKKIRIQQTVSGHPSIVKLVKSAEVVSGEATEFLVLSEFCPGGSVATLLKKRALSLEEVAKIFATACSAVRHLHNRPKPIVHRGVKAESLLYDATGSVRLCGFDRATEEIYTADHHWTNQERSQLEKELHKLIPKQYRASETFRIGQNVAVGQAQDIWGLGCLLYQLCYRKHPFEGCETYRIAQADYALDAVSEYSIFHRLIQDALRPYPCDRPEIKEFCDAVLATALSHELDTGGVLERRFTLELKPSSPPEVKIRERDLIDLHWAQPDAPLIAFDSAQSPQTPQPTSQLAPPPGSDDMWQDFIFSRSSGAPTRQPQDPFGDPVELSSPSSTSRSLPGGTVALTELDVSPSSEGSQRSLRSGRSGDFYRNWTLMGPSADEEKVNRWKLGKETNIRALLSSLNDVLWETAEPWRVTLVDLISGEQVREQLQNALAIVDPEKAEENSRLATLVVGALHVAWNHFLTFEAPPL
ncbi:hypothetical protein QR680_019108 [Steinernema hermaphroditum]|uniref:Protein kinase domain-containing protein n=1 Tax=Steinernema hermaphroditum TaxID=289476 RepID=A0AA39HLA2_9BILA|nr:hypothetical protein QR680_019108 [Steinernema hermaphroditum]